MNIISQKDETVSSAEPVKTLNHFIPHSLLPFYVKMTMDSSVAAVKRFYHNLFQQ